MENNKINRFSIKRKIKLLILFFSMIGIIMITKEVFNKEIMTLDKMGYQFISTYIMSDYVTPIAKTITMCGGAIVLITGAILSIILIKDKKIGFSISLNLLISTALNLILKNIVQRPRPIEYRLVNESGYSFPSGHSMVSAAFYGFVIYLIYANIENKKIKTILISTLSILVLLIGTSRIYLGVHYTSDVIAGFLISLSYLLIYVSIMKRTLLKQENRLKKS